MRTMRAAVIFLISLVFGTGLWAQDRVALVVGISSYENAPPLANPRNDATAIGRRLEALGFDVTLGIDLDYGDFSKALGRFSRKASKANLSLVYFAGHGIELSGENFMIPSDAEMAHEAEAEYETIALSKIMETSGLARQLSIVLVDACRNNPWADTIERLDPTRSLSRGLALVGDPGRGELISFATEAGQLALDGDGQNSPYAEALLTLLDEPGVEIGHFFRRLRGEVNRRTDGRQSPIVRSALPEQFIYLVPPDESRTTSQDADSGSGKSNEFFRSDYETDVLEVTDCDRAAGYQWNPRVEGGSIAFDAIKPEEAIPACQDALLEHPDEYFFYFLMGRALWKQNEDDPRIKRYMEIGGRADPAFAYERLGVLAEFGNGGLEQSVEQAEAYYLKSVEQGHDFALMNLGRIHAEATPPDFEKALRYYEDAIARGVSDAPNEMGQLHIRGKLPDASDAEALRYYGIGCEMGDLTACGNIGWMHSNGRVPEPDLGVARTRLGEACAGGEGWACRSLGHMHKDKRFDTASDADALRLFAKACDMGDANGCGNVGLMHRLERVARPDVDVQITQFTRACDGEEAWACRFLGHTHLEARMDTADDAEAFRLFTRACALGDANGCAHIGWMHYKDRVPEPDLAVAATRFDEACDGGEAWACRILGHMHKDQQIENSSDAQALSQFEMACEMGDINACGSAGWMHYKELVPSPDKAVAAERFAQACAGEEAWACRNLGHMHLDKEVAAASDAEAMRLFRTACDMGDINGCGNAGKHYEEGRLGQPDHSEAAIWYGKGCDLEDGWSCARLGDLYDDGDLGAAPDYANAVKFFETGCGFGNAWGCARAGELYHGGWGTDGDLGKAAALFGQSCEGGYAWGCGKLGGLIEAHQPDEAFAAYKSGCDGRDGNSCAGLGQVPSQLSADERGRYLVQSLELGSRAAFDTVARLDRDTRRAFQRALMAGGYLDGTDDGVIGPGTRAAMERAYDG